MSARLRHKIDQHVGRGSVAAVLELGATDEEEAPWSDELLPVPELPAMTSPCLRPTKSSLAKLHDLRLVHAGLEDEVEVGKERSF